MPGGCEPKIDIVTEQKPGVLLIDKPVGPTSFRIVQRVRANLGVKKVGHAGTLDPFASGLLIICVGRPATKIIPSLMGGDKTYTAKLRLGIETDTGDLEGTIVQEASRGDIDRGSIDACLQSFHGEQLQEVPQYSAAKHKGKPLYYYARKGITVEKAPRTIVIHRLKCLNYEPGELEILVTCTKGTYIRALARDIGRSLGCGAHLTALRRLQSGPFAVQDAIDGQRLFESERSMVPDLLRQSLQPVDLIEQQIAADATGQQDMEENQISKNYALSNLHVKNHD